MDNDKIDLNDLANRPDHKLTLVPREDPAERDTRLELERADAAHRRWKDRTVHVAALVVIGGAFGLCVWTILKAGSASEDAKWAVPLLSAIVSGLIGYVTGKAAK